MDPQIEELKELVRQNIALSTETNKIVRGMRNTGRMGVVMKIIFWIIIIASSVASYYYFLPYFTKIEKWYTGIQNGAQQAGDLQTQLLDSLKGLVQPQQ